jgi:predicted DNA-binding antitoxin AbrB/MazE fold protein
MTSHALAILMVYWGNGAIMTTRVHAVYRNGVFQPSAPPPVADGAEVELIVTTSGEPNSLADALDEIARLPAEGPQDGFSGADHDRVLYGATDKTPTARARW